MKRLTFIKVVANLLLMSSLLFSSISLATTLRLLFTVPVDGFDPAKVSDLNSASVIENIFDPLLTYDYYANDISLTPNVVDALPEILNDGKTYRFKITPGIYFSDDPVFEGKKRELVAADYVYSIKRFYDTSINSPYSYLIKGKLVGEEALIKRDGSVDYDMEFEGARALDRYTLEINLKQINYNFSVILAMPVFGAVAREAIEAYTRNTNASPVGTGPFQLKEWKPGLSIELERNKYFREQYFHKDAGVFTVSNTDISESTKSSAKRLPISDRVHISIIEEEQPQWLTFLDGGLDIGPIPQAARKSALKFNPNNPRDVQLVDSLQKRGISMQPLKKLEIIFYHFNMNDPVVGGYTKEKIALRRAIAMAFPRSETIAQIRRGQAVPVHYLIPEGVVGHNPDIKSSQPYNIPLANALLDTAGYLKGEDGFRRQPNGEPLEIEKLSTSSAVDKQWNEFWQSTFDSLSIRVRFKSAKFPELYKSNRTGKFQMWGLAWGADYPDGDNFVQMFYGPNGGDTNFSFFDLPELNELYEKSLTLPHGPERQALYDKMNRLVLLYQPYIYGDTRIDLEAYHGYVKNYGRHPLVKGWRFFDVSEREANDG